jgi:hypothetical protein
MDAGVVDKDNYLKQFAMPSFDKKESAAIRVRRLRLKFFFGSKWNCFRSNCPSSNKNENELHTLGCAGFAGIFFGSKRNCFCSHFPRFEPT